MMNDEGGMMNDEWGSHFEYSIRSAQRFESNSSIVIQQSSFICLIHHFLLWRLFRARLLCPPLTT